MRKQLLAASLSLGLIVSTIPAPAHANDDEGHPHIKHVLLISIDGMHAVDFENCANGISGANGGAPYCPTLAAAESAQVRSLDRRAEGPDRSRNASRSERR